MKFLKLLIILLLIVFPSIAQDWLQSKPCHYNVYDPATSGSSRKECIDATFKFDAPNFGGCTGTLINRNTDDAHLGFYFLTARHCFYGNDGLGPPDWDWEGVDVNFYFNYQSKDALTGSVPKSNRGLNDIGQSKLYDEHIFPTGAYNNDDYQYYHRSRIRVVTMQYWGDLALCEILTPIPVHFNITYAGWNPSRFADWNSYGSFAGIHHPKGDIKKISQTPHVAWLETPIATGCYTVTKIIDVLFGWVWKRKITTTVICKFIDNPKFMVPSWTKGGTEQGSSGSGMFSTQNKHFGVLSGSYNLNPCNDVFNQDFYGKLHSTYPAAAVRNTLNPYSTVRGENLNIDHYGMPKRKITCYPYLDLPGAPGVSGEYFPAKDYQADNTITLQSESDIITSQPINIYDSADYRFRAANTITLNPGFDARPGSTFIAEIGGCQTGVNQKTTEQDDEIIAALRQIQVPKQKEFDMSKYAEGSILSANNLYAQIYPNPNNGNFAVKLSKAGDYTLRISDMLGKVIYTSQISNATEFKIQLSGYATGNYLVQISSSSEQFVGKVVISE